MRDGLSITPLSVLSIDSYTGMVAPALHYLLPRLDSRGPILAFGCSNGAHPVGMGLAVETTTTELDIVWLYVLKAWRRRGVGRALVRAIEAHAEEHSRRFVRLSHLVESPGTVPLERLLEGCGWTLDTARLVVCALRASSISRAPWFDRWDRAASLDVFPWTELGTVERRTLESALAAERPVQDMPSPFDRERDMDPRTSVGLRRGGEVVGWCITHPAGPKTLRYSLLGVRGHMRGSGGAFAMVAAAVRRQIETYGADSVGAFATSTHNAAMAKLLRGSFGPHVAWKHEVSAAMKCVGG